MGRTVCLYLVVVLIAGRVEVDGLNISRSSSPQTVTSSYLQDASCGVVPKVRIRAGGLPEGTSSFGQVPWHAGIFHRTRIICSGILISSDKVLTSPLCVIAVESPDDLEVRLGDWDISSTDSVQESYDHFSASVSSVILYPDVPVGSGQATVALLKLSHPIDFSSYPQVAPICIPPIDFSLDKGVPENCFVSGWGSQNEDDSFQDEHTQNLKPHEAGSFAAPPRISLGNPSNESNSLESIKFHGVLSSPKYTDLDHSRNTGSQTKLPDPVEDYYNEANDDFDNNAQPDFPALLTDSDKEVSNPEGNSFQDLSLPILNHHEVNIYKHKLKYKQGKMSHAKHRKAHQFRNSNSHIRRQIKRSTHKKKRQLPGTVALKLIEVQLGNCSRRDKNNLDPNLNSPSSQLPYCIAPKRRPSSAFSCMLDLGSPVFCTTNQIRRSEDIQAVAKTYWIGMVMNTIPSCREFVVDSDGQHGIEVVSSFLHNFLPDIFNA